MKTDQIQKQLEILNSRHCALDFVRDYYGLDLDGDEPLRRDFHYWLKHQGEPLPAAETGVDRWLLELFLQTRGLQSRKWAALQLGMTLNSLNGLLEKMTTTGPILCYHVSGNIVGRTLEQDLLNLFDTLRFHTFPDHNSFCRQLHENLGREFDVAIEPQWCATSLEISANAPEYAKYIDAVTQQPLSPRYELWLKIGKWLTLPPDRCSLAIYARDKDLLKPYLADREVPDLLPEMKTFLDSA